MQRYTEILILLFLFSFQSTVHAQTRIESTRITYIDSYSLEITLNKTTNIVFPCAVKGVDRGSRDIIVQKGMGMENILQVKAAMEKFLPTSLSVVTTDGKLYSFLVTYAPVPAHLNMVISKDSLSGPFSFQKQVEPKLSIEAAQVAQCTPTLHGIKNKRLHMMIQLTGLYIRDSVMYYQLEWQNRSAINYDIESMRFFIRDCKRARRTATQETELTPLYWYGNPSVIVGPSRRIMVVALPKLTIADNQNLIIEACEKFGGRRLRLAINHQRILEAKKLKESAPVASR